MPRMGGDLGNELTFNSGRMVYCHNGVVGLALEGQGMPSPTYGRNESLDDLTPEERHELADAMIEAWKRFKLSVPV